MRLPLLSPGTAGEPSSAIPATTLRIGRHRSRRFVHHAESGSLVELVRAAAIHEALVQRRLECGFTRKLLPGRITTGADALFYRIEELLIFRLIPGHAKMIY